MTGGLPVDDLFGSSGSTVCGIERELHCPIIWSQYDIAEHVDVGHDGPRELCMIARSIELLMKLMREEDGQDLIEYAIVAGLIGVGAIVSLSSLDTKIKTAFNSVGSRLTSAT